MKEYHVLLLVNMIFRISHRRKNIYNGMKNYQEIRYEKLIF